jgi:hypothetical protein
MTVCFAGLVRRSDRNRVGRNRISFLCACSGTYTVKDVRANSGRSWDRSGGSGPEPFDRWSLKPECRSGPAVTPYAVLFATVLPKVDQGGSDFELFQAGLARWCHGSVWRVPAFGRLGLAPGRTAHQHRETLRPGAGLCLIFCRTALDERLMDLRFS